MLIISTFVLHEFRTYVFIVHHLEMGDILLNESFQTFFKSKTFQVRKNSCYTKFDFLNIFTEPIKFRVTSRIRIDVIMGGGSIDFTKIENVERNKINKSYLQGSPLCKIPPTHF